MSGTQLVFQIDEFFTRSKSGAIWGTVYFSDGQGRAFPDKGWTDLVAAFLGAWLAALVNLGGGNTFTERVRFYDGPMEVELNAEETGLVHLIFLNRDEPRLAVNEKLPDLLSESVKVAEKLLETCNERRWHNSDTARISALIESCTGLIARHKNGG